VVAAHYKKDDLLNCWTSSSNISDYLMDFHDGHGSVGAWHGMCELMAQYGRGMLCVNWP